MKNLVKNENDLLTPYSEALWGGVPYYNGGSFTIFVQYALDPEEYVFAALNLYLDIINLLLKILQIMQELRKKDGN